MLHNRYLIPGGEDESTAAEVALLREYGHEVELLEQNNLMIQQIGRPRTALRTVWGSESYSQISNVLSTRAFDVMHVQNFFPLWSPSVYYAAARHNIPVVQSLRNYRLFCANSTFYRSGHVCEDCLGRRFPWPAIAHGCYRRSRVGSAVVATMQTTHHFIGTWARKVSVYIALTEFARDKFIQGGLPAERIVVKPNFVHPSPAPGVGGGGYALFVGRLSPEKGVSTLLKAWQNAQSRLALKIVGDGPCQELVESGAAQNPSIHYLHRCSSDDVFDLLRNADFLIFPSEWYEGMPRVVIESFAVGTPVLASNIGATATMVTNGETGIHFRPGDPDDLCQKVEWCSQNLDKLAAMRTHARAAFLEKYTGQGNIDSLIGAYRNAQEMPRALR